MQKKGDMPKDEHEIQCLAPIGKAAWMDNVTEQMAICYRANNEYSVW